MKKIFFIIVLFFLASAKAGENQLIHSIQLSFINFFTTDNLGNAYAVVENQLLQFDKDGKPVANYSEKNLGTLRSVDANDPFKIVLFYPDYAQINTLNSKLALQSSIQLRSTGILNPTLACNSRNNGYWVYDLQDFQLKKIDLNLQLQHESGNLTQVTGTEVIPNFITEYDSWLYLNNPSSGILVFDVFGNYYKTIPVKNLNSFQLTADFLLYVENNQLKSYHLRTLEMKNVLLPSKDSVVTARFEKDRLYLLRQTSLNFYTN